MSAVEELTALPDVADATPSGACAEALAALEAELAAQDEQFQLLAKTMKLTGESLDALYADAEAGDVSHTAGRIVETVERVQRDFQTGAARSREGEARVDALVEKAVAEMAPPPAPLPPVRPRPARSVSSLSEEAVVAEPNAEPEEESFELVFPAGPLGLGVSVMRDRNSSRAHVIVDSVLESYPHAASVRKMDEITRIGGAALPPARPDDDPKVHLDGALELIKRAPRPLTLGFHRNAGRYQQADVSDRPRPRETCLPPILASFGSE